jgi:hypothetical protein
VFGRNQSDRASVILRLSPLTALLGPAIFCTFLETHVLLAAHRLLTSLAGAESIAVLAWLWL